MVVANKHEVSAKLDIEKKFKQERLQKEQLEKIRVEAGQFNPKPSVAPEEDSSFTAKSAKTMAAPLKSDTLYKVLKYSNTVTRPELKQAYLYLEK